MLGVQSKVLMTSGKGEQTLHSALDKEFRQNILKTNNFSNLKAKKGLKIASIVQFVITIRARVFRPAALKTSLF